MEEVEVWRTANVLIKLHSEQAAFVAAERADELFAKDDFLGCTIWTRVVRAILEIERQKPRDGEAVN